MLVEVPPPSFLNGCLNDWDGVGDGDGDGDGDGVVMDDGLLARRRPGLAILQLVLVAD